jgi:hypothetical protein
MYFVLITENLGMEPNVFKYVPIIFLLQFKPEILGTQPRSKLSHTCNLCPVIPNCKLIFAEDLKNK